MTMSRRDIERLHDSMRDSHAYIQSARDGGGSSGKSTTGKVLETLEVGAGAVGVGVLAGRLQTTSIGSTGVPLGLALGFAGHAAAFFDLAGKYGEHLHNVSNGAIAGWLAMWGAGQGMQMRQKANLPLGPITAGNNALAGVAAPRALHAPSPASRPLTEQELAVLAARMR
jgi:hypothetical protein